MCYYNILNQAINLFTVIPLAFIFEKLEVYKKAVDFAAIVDDLCNDLPRGKYFLADQLRRASLSISLNIAEGNGRWHTAERRQFFVVARGSTHECIPILELLRKGSHIDAETHAALRARLEELGRMIAGLISGLERRK